MKGRGRPAAGVTNEPVKKIINTQDKRDLKTLAKDFGLFHRENIQEKQKRNNTNNRYEIS